MKRTLGLIVALLLMVTSLAFAEDMDLTTFTDEELNGLENAILIERESRANTAEQPETDEPAAPAEEQAEVDEPAEPAVEEAPVFEPLQRDTRSDNVRVLQEKLKELGYSVGLPDGIFGPKTEAGVKELQAAMGLEPTGVVTEELFNAITNNTQSASADVAESVSIQENLFVNADSYTEGAFSNDYQGFTFVTNVENNSFSHVLFQIFDKGWNHLQNIESMQTGNVYTGEYTHASDSGEYNVVLKGNTNLHDEYVSKTISLENGRTYSFSFTVDSLEAQRVETSNVAFGLKGE